MMLKDARHASNSDLRMPEGQKISSPHRCPWIFGQRCEREQRVRLLVIAAAISLPLCFVSTSASAGMPALLPTDWTADSSTHGDSAVNSDASFALRLQAVSFFLVVFLVCGWILQRTWNSVAPQMLGLPWLNYRRALSLLLLWGICFVVVLTMISGARELMTPGAWRKQGWTYSLRSSSDVSTDPDDSFRPRRAALERLRTALWQFAATHQGQLPNPEDPRIPSELWNVPEAPGLRFLAVSGRMAEEAGRLYVFEPDADGNERLVLLTNGLIGTMNSSEIKAAVAANDATVPQKVTR